MFKQNSYCAQYLKYNIWIFISLFWSIPEATPYSEAKIKKAF